jgi:hypothetical protein
MWKPASIDWRPASIVLEIALIVLRLALMLLLQRDANSGRHRQTMAHQRESVKGAAMNDEALMSDIIDDLRAAQKATDDSNTALLLGRAADEIEEMRDQYRVMLQNYQHQLLRLGNGINNYLAHGHD